MRKTVLCTLLVLFSIQLSAQTPLPQPADYFGFDPGSDRQLFDYEQLIGYLEELDAASERVYMENIGQSPMGRPMYAVFISTEENIRKLDRLKEINRALALDENLSQDELNTLTSEGRVFAVATLSMHSTEVAPSQSAPLVAYELAGTSDPEQLEWLENVVYMMVPCHNPDGMNMVVENYRKHLGTPYEGASLPGVYHKYVGHDNNRDFVILSQEDSRAISRLFSQTWFPQVMVEKHQMGSTGPRYFVPPNHDPIAENVPAGVFHWCGVFGQHMATDMTADGCAGVSQHYLFDNYWPGSTETCIWKNVIGFLTEAASVQTATPIYIEPGELRVGGKGLSEYKKSINMLDPWEGGWWRLGDLVKYELSSTRSILRTASKYRAEILDFRNRMCREQVELGRSEAPYYYILPAEQHDVGEMVELVKLLQMHGIRTCQLTRDLEIGRKLYKAGDVVIPLAQPFRAFIKEVMETQAFPERHYTPGGKLIRPYDITTWSLPLHRQVISLEIGERSAELEAALEAIEGSYSLRGESDEAVQALLLPVEQNASFRAAFAALSAGMKVERLKVDVDYEGERYGKGSFIVYHDRRKAEAWSEIWEALPFRPGLVAGKRAFDADVLEMPRIALIETWFHDMDAGWTRYVLDQYHLPFTVLRPGDVAAQNLAADFDVILFADSDKSLLMNGRYKSASGYSASSYHPDYLKGIGKAGMKKLMQFSDAGGTVVAWGRSTRLFEGLLEMPGKEDTLSFALPFRDVSPQLSKEGLYVPGSLVAIDLKADHPLTMGMPARIGVFSRGRPVFRTSIPYFDMDRRVVASYPEEDIVISGYGDKTEQMARQAAMVWMRKGEGQFVFYGFNPQFRASTQGSFKLLFNALLL